MSLFAQITSIDGNTKVQAHAAFAGLVEYQRSKQTKTWMKSNFNFDTSSKAEIEIIITALDKMTDTAKLSYVNGFHAAVMMAETGIYDEAKFNTSLGI